MENIINNHLQRMKNLQSVYEEGTGQHNILGILINELTDQLHQYNNISSSSFDLDKFANALKDEFGESLVEENGSEEDAYNWWLTDVTVTDIVGVVKSFLQFPTFYK